MEKLARRPFRRAPKRGLRFPAGRRWRPPTTRPWRCCSEVLATKRKFSEPHHRAAGPTYLRQTERSKLAEKILADQQQGNDILVVAAQAGMLHRGSSARRTRVAMAGNEFGLGVFAFGCMLLTHPERLSTGDTLMIDCGGDEYSVRGDYTFDRVPLFDYDISGIEFSIFYEDRARNLWGTPTGFLYKMV